MKILAIGCHIDDIEIACGGVLAQAIKNKHTVKTLIMTKSDYSDYRGKIYRTQLQALSEGIEALKVLGIEDYKILNFPTKDVPYNSSSIEAINKVIDDFNPDLILTHWSFDTHQAHQSTSLATISASRYKNNILLYEPFPPSGRSYIAFKPQVYIDISDTINLKLKSLKKHKTQHKKYGNQWIEAVKGRAKLRGFECNKNYAEVFEVLRLEYLL